MNLEELFKETDALTYVNALRVTLTEVKDCVSSIEELTEYQQNECNRLRKLMRKADTQYRVVSRIVQNGEAPLATSVTLDENIEDIEELMKND